MEDFQESLEGINGAPLLSPDVLEHPDVPGRLYEGHDEATAGDSDVRKQRWITERRHLKRLPQRPAAVGIDSIAQTLELNTLPYAMNCPSGDQEACVCSPSTNVSRLSVGPGEVDVSWRDLGMRPAATAMTSVAAAATREASIHGRARKPARGRVSSTPAAAPFPDDTLHRAIAPLRAASIPSGGA